MLSRRRWFATDGAEQRERHAPFGRCVAAAAAAAATVATTARAPPRAAHPAPCLARRRSRLRDHVTRRS